MISHNVSWEHHGYDVISEAETARVLGITVHRGKPRSAMWISRVVTDGLPLSALENLVHQVSPDDKNFVYKFISKPTLARRKKAYYLEWKARLAASGKAKTAQFGIIRSSEKQKFTAKAGARKYLSRSKIQEAVLSPTEGAKVARLAEVWAMTRRVWGSDAEARAFLFRPHPLLEDSRPIDVVIADEFGRPLVEGILGRLQYGSAP